MKKAKEIKKEIETAKTQVEKSISKFPKLPKINFKLPFVGKKENNKFDFKKVTSSKEFKFGVILLAAFVLGFFSKKYFIAATVNGQVITRFQVIKELEKRQGQSALESIVTQTLIEQEAKAKNATVTAEEIAAELKTIEDQIATQGESLDELLAAQGMTRTQLTDQIRLQKLVEKLLGDRLNVTDEEVNKFIEDNKASFPEGMGEDEIKNIVKDQLKQEKMSGEFQAWLEDLQNNSKVNYIIKY